MRNAAKNSDTAIDNPAGEKLAGYYHARKRLICMKTTYLYAEKEKNNTQTKCDKCGVRKIIYKCFSSDSSCYILGCDGLQIMC